MNAMNMGIVTTAQVSAFARVGSVVLIALASTARKLMRMLQF